MIDYCSIIRRNKLCKCMGQQKIASRSHEYMWYTMWPIYKSLKCLTKNLHYCWTWKHYISMAICTCKLWWETTEDKRVPSKLTASLCWRLLTPLCPLLVQNSPASRFLIKLPNLTWVVWLPWKECAYLYQPQEKMVLFYLEMTGVSVSEFKLLLPYPQ